MPDLAWPWPTMLLGVAIVGVAAMWLPRAVATLRTIATVVTGLVCVIAIAAAIDVLGGGPGRDPSPLGAALSIDELSALLLPFASLVWLAVLVLAPTAMLDRGKLRGILLSELVVLATFLARDPILLAVFWTISIAILLVDLRGAERRVRRIAMRYLGTSAFAFWAGAIALKSGDAFEIGGIALVFLAVMIRKGIVPLHGWMPELFEHGRFGSALLFSVPQIGAYAAAVLIVPRAPAPLLTAIGILALVTAVYGAAMALVQRDPRRAFGWLFMSQSALVMAGLESASLAGLTGALSLWISSGLALGGFGITLWLLEARRGRLSLDRLHGGYDSMPLLAASFVVLGMASVGFPGTLGFVGEELLIDGAVEQFPHIGFFVIIAAALGGIAVMRMYFALFCGARRSLLATLRPRERVVFSGLVALLLLGGLLPGPIVESRTKAARVLFTPRPTVRP